MTPRWYSQPFPPAGSISAEGIKKTLGKPPIPWPAILVREAAQNSWDARLDDRPVRFGLSLGAVLPQHMNAWQNALLAGAPPADKFLLRKTVRSARAAAPVIRTLTISDRGTKGLGGPTRADIPRGSAARDWVSFVLNVGDPPDTKNGGGTYGYGKGVLFQMSRAGTVLVHTRTRGDKGLENRLIGICLGESVELRGEGGELRPYTGRHWWGDVREDHVEPLLGAEATATANALGLPKFEDEDTGTDLVVVDPEFDDESDAEVARYLADAIAWNLWPIMLERRGDDRLVAEVRCMGEIVPVAVPEKTRGLKIFVAAYEHLKSGVDGRRTVKCGNPRKDLGLLALERQLLTSYSPPPAAQDLGVTSAPHHVCLLRTPELVVRYLPGPPPISTDLAYAGVFRAHDDLDRTYADSEPPTHDDWVPAQLQGHDRTYVKMTFARIKEALGEFVKPAETSTHGSGIPLGTISNYLGSLVAAAGGTGSASAPWERNDTSSASKTPSIPDGSRRAAEDSSEETPEFATDDQKHFAPQIRRRASVRVSGEPYFIDEMGELRLAQDFVVVGDGRLSIRGTASVTVADGTTEGQPPAHADHPAVVGWRTDSVTTAGDLLDVNDARAGTIITLLISPAPDTVTQAGITMLRDGSSHGE